MPRWEPEAACESRERIIMNLNRLAKLGQNKNDGSEEEGENYKTYVPCVLHGVATVGMADSGNTFFSSISEDFAKALGVDVRYLKQVPGYERVKTASSDDEALQVLGQVRQRLLLKFPKRVRPLYIKPMVVRGLSMPLNFSGPWMQQNNMLIDPGRGLVYDRAIVPFTTFDAERGEGFQHLTCSLYTTKGVTVEPGTVTYAEVKVPDRMAEQYRGQKVVVMGNQAAFKRRGLRLFQRTLVQLKDHDGGVVTKVGYLNNTKKPVKIPRGTMYGQGYPVTNEAGITKQPWKICLLDRPTTGPENTEGTGKSQKGPDRAGGTDPVIKAQHEEFKRDGQTKKLEDWMEGPTTKDNFQRRCQHLREVFKLDENKNLSEEKTKNRLLMMLAYFWTSFSWDGRIGRTNLIKHHLTMKKGAKPVKQRVRPMHPALEPSLQAQLLKWLENDIIQPSDSEWNSNLLAVYKPGGAVRWVVDFTSVNKVTEADVFSVGDVNGNLNRLAKSKLFSTIDSQGAYHVVPIHEEDRHRTAFITPWNVFEFRYMPFGMAAAGSTFCRLNQLILGRAGISEDECLAYIDDLLILGDNSDQHLANLFKTIKAYTEAGILLNPKKTHLFQSEVRYLGYLIDSQGVRTLPEYVEAVVSWEVPRTRKALRVFCGKINYYKRFIRNYAVIAKPLTDALKTTGKYAGLADTDEFEPDADYIEAFEKLKTALVTAPCLAHPRFDRLDREVWVLDTDWSEDNLCIGAALHQRQLEVVDGEEVLIERPIAYMSKKLGDEAKSYSPTKGELAAVIYFLEYFSWYSTVGKVILRSDHQALSALKNSTEQRGQWARWRQRLAAHDYELEYRPGEKGQNADSLSRAPHIKVSKEGPLDIFNEAEEGLQISSLNGDRRGALEKRLSVPGLVLAAVTGVEELPSIDEVRDMQNNNEAIRLAKQMVFMNNRPTHSFMEGVSYEARELLAEFDQLELNNGVLYYITQVRPNEYAEWQNKRLIVLSEEAAYDVVNSIHRYHAHIGFANTLDKAVALIHSQRLRQIVKDVCTECVECGLKGGQKKAQRHTLVPIRSGDLFDLLSIDFCGPWPKTRQGYEYLLTIEDCFSRWLHAVPVRRATAESVFDAIVTHWTPMFGLPSRIKTDNGTPFVSKLVGDLADMLKVEYQHSTSYHAASNPVERQHLNLKRALTALCKNHTTKWVDYLPQVLFSLRIAYHDALQGCPYQVVFARMPRTSVDNLFGEPPGQENYTSYHHYVKSLKNRIEVAHKWARENINKAVARSRMHYNRKMQSFEIGDLVWLFSPKVAKAGKRTKFASHWSGPWKVTKKLSDVTYRIKTHPRWARQQEIIVSIDRLKRFHCAEGDEDTPGYPPAIDQQLDLIGDDHVECLSDPGEEDIADSNQLLVEDDDWDTPQDFYFDDDYQDQEDLEGDDDEDVQDEERQQDPVVEEQMPPEQHVDEQDHEQHQGMQLRRGPRETRKFTDYKILANRGRDLALINPVFDNQGNLELPTRDFQAVTTPTDSSKIDKLRKLTSQSRVLENRERASSYNLHRFT